MKNDKKPQVRFKGFNDDWEQRKLSDVADVRDGTHASPKYISEGHPLVTSKNVKDGFVNYDDIQYISDEDFDEINKRSKVDVNDVLIGMIGTIGNIALIRKEPDFAIKNVALIKDAKKINYLYIYHFLQSNSTIKQLTNSMDGGTQKFIALGNIRNLDIDIPSDQEQAKLGQYFESLDNLITLHQRKCDKLQKIKKSMLEKMFPQSGMKKPEIRFKGFNDDWEQRKLGEMGSTFTGLSGKTKEDFGHGDAKFITYMNVFSNPIANLDMTEYVEIDSKQNCVKAGDVFFTTSSETPEEVGMSCVMSENADNIYLNSFCFGYRPTVEFDLNYLAYVLRAESFRKNMTFLAQGISRYNISKNKVMEIKISVPSLDEQNLVGAYFSDLDHLITLHQRKLEKLKYIKKSMLENMFV